MSFMMFCFCFPNVTDTVIRYESNASISFSSSITFAAFHELFVMMAGTLFDLNVDWMSI